MELNLIDTGYNGYAQIDIARNLMKMFGSLSDGSISTTRLHPRLYTSSVCKKMLLRHFCRRLSHSGGRTAPLPGVEPSSRCDYCICGFRCSVAVARVWRRPKVFDRSRQPHFDVDSLAAFDAYSSIAFVLHKQRLIYQLVCLSEKLNVPLPFR